MYDTLSNTEQYLISMHVAKHTITNLPFAIFSLDQAILQQARGIELLLLLFLSSCSYRNVTCSRINSCRNNGRVSLVEALGATRRRSRQTISRPKHQDIFSRTIV